MKRFREVEQRCCLRAVARALDILIWKLPHQYRDAEEFGRYIACELADKGFMGIRWSERREEFYVSKRRPL